MRGTNVLTRTHKDNLTTASFVPNGTSLPMDLLIFHDSDLKSESMCNPLNFPSRILNTLLTYFLPRNSDNMYEILSSTILSLDKYNHVLDIPLVSLFLYLRFRKGLKAPVPCHRHTRLYISSDAKPG